MQELCRHLDEVRNSSMEKPLNFWVQASQDWASFVLANNTGKALHEGLEISKAMIRYADAIKYRQE